MQRDSVIDSAEVDRAVKALIAGRYVPVSTYRIQFHPGFRFADALAIGPYLHNLGVSDLYASPVFTARVGSTHGYDVCDYSQLSPALGGAADFAALAVDLRARAMGVVLDMVPNHMGIGEGNPWWMDVLENGPASPYAGFFDIEWQPVKPELAGKVLLPILEDQYGVVLEQAKLRLELEQGSLTLVYHETRLPIAPRTMRPLLLAARTLLPTDLDPADGDAIELESIITALGYLPARDETDAERLAERQREKEVVKRRLAALAERSTMISAALAAALERFNGVVGDPRSFDLLDALIDQQPYRLAFWRVAAEEINYRRFFDINDLAAIRVERPAVFDAAHELVFRLIGAGDVRGLRIDHPDGLADPPAYFRQLQERYLYDQLRARQIELPEEELGAALNAWSRDHAARRAGGAATWPLYVVAEKILSEHEPLPPDWAVDGTTGYDFLNAANGIFVDSASAAALDGIYRRFIAPDAAPDAPDFAELVYAAKQEIMDSSLVSEITSLVHQLERVNEKNRRVRDFTLRGITQALSTVIASMSIYRTYISDPAEVSARDRRYVDAAVRVARRRQPRIPRSLFAFIRDTLLLQNLAEFRPEDRPEVIATVMRLQQLTGPVMAKSVEDTVFYRYHRLTSLNEVGGHPDQVGLSVAGFHQQAAARARLWPNAMLASSTHDTKRSEDVRARINVLSELPGEWEAAVTRWSRWNERHRQRPDEALWPERNSEYLLYQTLVGAWPEPTQAAGHMSEPAAPGSGPAAPAAADGAQDALASFRERIVAYMQKATKEAKLHTSWINPDESYDTALRQFSEAILDARADSPFLGDLAAFARRVAAFGRINSLAQTLLKLTAPGVPDIYQGSELWDLSLVDPDNRRPVDYELRQRLLADLDARGAQDRAALARELLAQSHDGRIKLYLVATALRHRRAHARLFATGDYRPLLASGARAGHLCAFARTLDAEAVLTVVPRLVVGLTGGAEDPPIGPKVWGDTRLELPPELAGARFRDLLSGQMIAADAASLPVATLLAQLPVGLLERVA